MNTRFTIGFGDGQYNQSPTKRKTKLRYKKENLLSIYQN